MKLLKNTLSFIIVILILLSLCCTAQVRAFANQNFHIGNRSAANVAVLIYSFDDFFSSQIKQNLEDIEKENKDKVHFTFYDGKNNIAIQNETLDSVIRSNVDLIIGSLVNSNEDNVENIIFKAKQKNVPLILLTISPEVVSKVSKYYDKVSFISSDFKQQGIYQGKLLVDLWNTNKSTIDKNGDNRLQYVLLQGKVNNPIAIDRTKYVISSINDSGINTEQLALVNADWSEELAQSSIESLFLRYNDSIEAIIANNDSMAIGAVKALQKYGYNKGDKSKNIAVVSIDGIPEAKDLIDKGFMTGTIIHDPKIFAEQLYTIGMNLIKNLSPIENTDNKLVDGIIIIPFPYEAYIKK